MHFVPARSYQPLARRTYAVLARRIRGVLPKAEVQHMGASAVPGLWSKGDLDVYVAVDPKAFSAAVKALRGLGFAEKPGIPRNRLIWPFAVTGYQLDVGVQLVAAGSEVSESFLVFRDLLRQHPPLRAEYNRLKRACAGLSQARYRRIKRCFVEGLVALAAAGSSLRR